MLGCHDCYERGIHTTLLDNETYWYDGLDYSDFEPIESSFGLCYDCYNNRRDEEAIEEEEEDDEPVNLNGLLVLRATKEQWLNYLAPLAKIFPMNNRFRSYLNGVRVEINDSKVRMWATDMDKGAAAFYPNDITVDTDGKFAFTIPKKAITHIRKLPKGSEVTIRADLRDNYWQGIMDVNYTLFELDNFTWPEINDTRRLIGTLTLPTTPLPKNLPKEGYVKIRWPKGAYPIDIKMAKVLHQREAGKTVQIKTLEKGLPFIRIDADDAEYYAIKPVG